MPDTEAEAKPAETVKPAAAPESAAAVAAPPTPKPPKPKPAVERSAEKEKPAAAPAAVLRKLWGEDADEALGFGR